MSPTSYRTAPPRVVANRHIRDDGGRIPAWHAEGAAPLPPRGDATAGHLYRVGSPAWGCARLPSGGFRLAAGRRPRGPRTGVPLRDLRAVPADLRGRQPGTRG